ncbi:MAG: phosphotransferase [Desulfobacterales bacterium]|nr:MAG: phosphotransferase [Desulfobacterales bacterium]
MKRAGHRASRTAVAGLWKNIEKYLKNMPPDILAVRQMDSLQFHKMTPGAYNLNFHVSIENKEFIFRVNIEPQSGLRKQIEYEYNILKFLQAHSIAPDVYHIDDTREHFEFDILIEQYLAGPHLAYQKSRALEVAELLARLHGLTPQGMNFITWQDPLRDTYQLAANDLINYRTRKTAEKKIVSLSSRILERIRSRISQSALPFQPDCLNHTDVVCDNFIRTSEGLRMIDWEKPRVDDRSYDLSCFLSEPAQLWCTADILAAADRQAFLEEYARRSYQNAELLFDKVCLREPIVSLHWILWGATKLCDLREQRTSPELLGAHEAKISRYERLVRMENVEKVLGAL